MPGHAELSDTEAPSEARTISPVDTVILEMPTQVPTSTSDITIDEDFEDIEHTLGQACAEVQQAADLSIRSSTARVETLANHVSQLEKAC